MYALDAYNNTVPTAEGTVTVTVDNGDAVCDVCTGETQLLEGVATFEKLGLLSLPGGVASLVFASDKGAPSAPMEVTMQQCGSGSC